MLKERVRKAGSVIVSLVLAACGSGDWSEYEPNSGSLPDDEIESAVYPAGPYNTNVGDTVENIVFDRAFFDPDTLCKKAKDLDITRTDGPQPLALYDLYKGDALCQSNKKQFLFLIAAAGW